MEILKLEELSEYNAAWSLLRKTSAPYVISFLYQVFKTDTRTEIPSDQLVLELDAFQKLLEEKGIEALKGSAESVLASWASDSEQILWRSHDAESDSYVFTLRATTEEVLHFIENLLNTNQPISAESSLKRIFLMLEDVVLMGQGDVDAHVKRLAEKRDAIQQEIDRIKTSGMPENQAYRIRDEFRAVLSEIRSLTSDFRKVEELFRSIASDLQHPSSDPDMARGDILEYMLLSDEEIRNSDQGRSFYGFLSLLNSPEQLNRLDDLRDALKEIKELEGIDKTGVMKFERRLLLEAQRVQKTIQRLSRQLKRILDDKANAERQRMLGKIQNIWEKVTLESFEPHSSDAFLSTESVGTIHLLADYQPYRPPVKLQQFETKLYDFDLNSKEAAFDEFRSLQRLDMEKMKDHICLCLSNKTEVTIKELIAKYPTQHGLVELAGYLQLAHDHNCPIDHSNAVVVEIISQTNEPLRVKIPQVVFNQHAFIQSNHTSTSTIVLQ